MATRIYLRNGLGKPDVSDFGGTTGEILIDLQNYQIWTLSADTSSVEQLGSDISSETISWDQLDPNTIPDSFPPEAHDHDYTEVNNGAGKTLDVEIADILAHLSNIDSELGALQGNLTFGGTVDLAKNEIVTLTDAADNAGFTLGTIPNPPPPGSLNIYFIVVAAGDFDGGTYASGDWLVSEDQAGGWAGVHFDSSVTVLWDEIGGKPTEFPPEAHTHEIADVTGLQDALDDLSPDGHTHEIADINGLQTELDGKASIVAISCGTY